MNGVHDMGGMHGLGPVNPEPNEPVFHTDWEKKVFALNLAMGAWRKWNIDGGRYSRELMPPAEYLATGYYEHWLWGLELLLKQNGFVRDDEVAERERATLAGKAPMASARPAEGALRPHDVPRYLQNRRAARMSDPVPPKFKAGDEVVAKRMNPLGHTRLPRYVRGRRGVIDRDHGVFIFPDTHAAGLGRKPQHVYAVRFTARELWGPEASPRDAIYVDLWDDYLDPA
jgi:nitrile hydratase